MKAHSLQVIGDKTEEELITWRNEKVEDDLTVKSLKDKKFCNSLYFINIMKTIEPRSINWIMLSLIKKMMNPNKIMLNMLFQLQENSELLFSWFGRILLKLKASFF